MRSSSPGDALRSLPALDQEIRSDALAVLRDLQELEFTQGRWAEIEQAVETLQDALRRADEDAARAVIGNLEVLCARAVRVASVRGVGAPATLMDRSAILIHRLERAAVPTRDEPRVAAERDGGGDDDPAGFTAGRPPAR